MVSNSASHVEEEPHTRILGNSSGGGPKRAVPHEHENPQRLEGPKEAHGESPAKPLLRPPRPDKRSLTAVAQRPDTEKHRSPNLIQVASTSLSNATTTPQHPDSHSGPLPGPKKAGPTPGQKAALAGASSARPFHARGHDAAFVSLQFDAWRAPPSAMRKGTVKHSPEGTAHSSHTKMAHDEHRRARCAKPATTRRRQGAALASVRSLHPPPHDALTPPHLPYVTSQRLTAGFRLGACDYTTRLKPGPALPSVRIQPSQPPALNPQSPLRPFKGHGRTWAQRKAGGSSGPAHLVLFALVGTEDHTLQLTSSPELMSDKKNRRRKPRRRTSDAGGLNHGRAMDDGRWPGECGPPKGAQRAPHL